MVYVVEFKPSAAKTLASLPKKDQRRIARKIDGLAENPRPTTSVKLAGSEFYRVRVGMYRIIYDIQDTKLTVLIVRIGHRRDAYDRLPR